ncbi:MAG: TonB C-terminal domain-containing protein [Epsilonproteobacteria bacterium]|nr:hypothetical protein [Campylobacterota bacterium]NPA56681.1 TonB C-terminal domain-containing protein [Campylobacterota bacterium]
MDRLGLKLSSLLASIALYLFLLYLLATHFVGREKPKRLEIKGQTIDVLLESPKPKEKTPPHPPTQRSQPTPTPPQKTPSRGSPSPKPVQTSVKDLFASLNSKRYTTKKTTYKPPRVTPSRLKSRRERVQAKKLLSKLNLKELDTASRKSIKAVSGENDPYLQRVYKILYENWTPSKLSAGSSGKVEITIDPSGAFSYRVVQWSENELFNRELRDYLNYLRTIKFPRPKKRRTFLVRFEAKE